MSSPSTHTRHTPDVSVISPVYGCKGCLENLVDRIATALLTAGKNSFEVILVDDASPDDAWGRILELSESRPWIRGIRLSRNFGQHYAIAAGIENAAGQQIVVMDCDLQDVPEEIPTLLAGLEKGADIVFAQRIDRQDRKLKRLGSWTFFRLLSWLTDVEQDHTTANFGAFNRKVIDTINSMPERERCFPLMVKWSGFKRTSIPVSHAPRTEGKSTYNFRKLLRLGTNIVLSYSDKPLRLVVRLGIIFSFLAFLMVTLSIFRFIRGDIQLAGFTSIVASIWLVGGVTIFCLGIVGLYVGKQFNDSKARPYYIISEHTSKPSTPTNPQGRKND